MRKVLLVPKKGCEAREASQGASSEIYTLKHENWWSQMVADVIKKLLNIFDGNIKSHILSI